MAPACCSFRKLEYEVVGVADVEGGGVGECFGSVGWAAAVVVVVEEQCWMGWKDDNAGHGDFRPYSLQSFCDTNLRTGPKRSCTKLRETGRSDQSVEEEAAQEGQIVARHFAMHPFDEPRKKKKTISWWTKR